MKNKLTSFFMCAVLILCVFFSYGFTICSVCVIDEQGSVLKSYYSSSDITVALSRAFDYTKNTLQNIILWPSSFHVVIIMLKILFFSHHIRQLIWTPRWLKMQISSVEIYSNLPKIKRTRVFFTMWMYYKKRNAWR